MIDDCAACTSIQIAFYLVGYIGVDKNEHAQDLEGKDLVPSYMPLMMNINMGFLIFVNLMMFTLNSSYHNETSTLG